MLGIDDARPRADTDLSSAPTVRPPSRVGAGDIEATSDWGFSMLRSADSVNEQPSSLLGRPRSVPMFPASPSPMSSTWHSGPSWASSGKKKTNWKPLGSTWRDWEANSASHGDSQESHVSGVVPNWSNTTSMRVKGLIEHELSWSYYQMRRHTSHPLRNQVGETLRLHDVIAKEMCNGIAHVFEFWRDLRPPFSVLEVKRANTGQEVGQGGFTRPHPDGVLYYVKYSCAIDYSGERLWGLKSDATTFNNRIMGVAKIRIPSTFPEKHMLMESWGRPTFNWIPGSDTDIPDDSDKPIAVDPDLWMPIADELKVRPSVLQLAKCRALSRQASMRAHLSKKRGPEIPEMQRLLIGPPPPLAKLAAAEQRLADGVIRGHSSQQKTRQRTVLTASSGFVTYVG